MTTRTYTQYLLALSADEQQLGVTQILSAMSVLGKEVAGILSRGPLIVDAVAEGGSFSRGEVVEEVKKSFADSLRAETASIRQLGAISIEDERGLIPVSETGRYLLLTDGLQGMANFADNLMVGTTFSILERDSDTGPVTEQDFLQPGSKQVCAGLILFGVRTLLLLTTGSGVDGFTLDRDLGSFVLTHPQMQVPKDAPVYTVDATQAPHWPAPIKRYVDECIQGEEGPRGQDFSMRWNASALVGAFRVLNSGGLFMAPDIGKSSHLLPLMHNAAPLAFLIEQAGGASSTGTQRVMDVVPKSLDEKTSYYLGSAAEVERVEQYYSDHENGLDEETSYPLFGHRSLFAG